MQGKSNVAPAPTVVVAAQPQTIYITPQMYQPVYVHPSVPMQQNPPAYNPYM